MTDKEKIRAEIERLKKDWQCYLRYSVESKYRTEAYSELIDFIDSLSEEPVSEKKCMFTKDSYTDEDRKVLCDGCEEECEYAQKKEPVSKVWHDPDEEPEVERTIIWEDEKMMGKHLFQGQWKPKIDVFGRKERWCYLSDILNL